MSTPTVLLYTRPWFAEYYTLLAEAISKGCGYSVEMFGDYPGRNGYNLRLHCLQKFYRKGGRGEIELLSRHAPDIIKRDRLLRKLPVGEAEERIRAYYCAIAEYMQSRKVKCVVSATIDQYVIDLVYLYCLEHDIPFIGYHISLLPGLTLITARGEKNGVRTVSDAEVSKYVELVSDARFRPTYIPSKSKFTRIGLNRYLKGLARLSLYSFLEILPGSTLNYHVEVGRRESWTRANFSVLRALFRRFQKRTQSTNYIYLPLQFHPECNSEYWTRMTAHMDYEDSIVDVCARFKGRWSVVVKEHPNMIGIRSSAFYSRLEKVGCEIVDPGCDHRQLIEGSKAVLTLNSSAGIEALCHDKPVICLSLPYYASSGHVLVENASVELLDSPPDAIEGVPDSLFQSIRSILEASLPVTLQDIWLSRSGTDLTLARQSAADFAGFLNTTIDAVRENKVSISAAYTIKDLGSVN